MTGAPLRSKRRNERISQIVMHLIMVPLAVLWLFPIYLMAVYSTMPDQAIFDPGINLIPGSGFGENLRLLEQDTGFSRSIINSFVVALVFTALSIMLTSMAGWALARYRFVGSGLVAGLVLGTLTLPYFVIVIPQYIMVARDFGLANTWFALIVPPLFSSLGVLFMRQAFLAMPGELFDAARVEGVREWQIFTRVALPLARPTMAALAIILFLASWNNYLWPLLINTEAGMQTAPVALGALIGVTKVSWGGIMVGAVMMTLPMLIMFVLLQRQFTAGIAAGAVK